MTEILERAATREPGLAELRALVDLAPDGIFIADIEGRYTFVNEAGCRLLGRVAGELIGKSIVDLIPDDEAGRLLASKERMLLGESHSGEWHLRRADGAWVPVEVNAKILPDGRWIGFVRDVSDRRADEAERDAALKAAESDRRWLNTVLETMPFGVLLFQPGGQLYFNRRTEELLGIKLSPTGGSAQYAGRILYPDGRPVPPEELLTSRVLREGKTIIAAEFRVLRPDGTQIPVLSSAAPIRDADGGVIGGVGAFQDMSERMRMEQAIRANERLLRGIFAILPVGVWVADKTGRIVSNNPAGERIWRGARYVPSAEFGQYKGWWADTGKPIAAEEWALARAITKGETSDAELIRIQCFDGSFKTIINTAAPLRDEHGEIAGAIVVNEDISALQHTQEQLRAAVRDREE
ncbi:MAG TPA: PAS domain S-box protein, partial [Burkholderiales bacterium]